MRARLLAGICLLFFAQRAVGDNLKTEYGKKNDQAQMISLVVLLSGDAAAAGKPVAVIGAVKFEFEGTQVCLSKEDIRYAVSTNCLWLRVDFAALGATEDQLASFNGEFVLLEGVFDPTDKGPFALQSGALHHVSRLLAWEREVPDRAPESKPDR